MLLLTQVDTRLDRQAGMEIFRFQILPQQELDRREALKASENNCPHCGGALEFKVEVDVTAQLLSEQCHCPVCTIEVRSGLYNLQ